MDEERDKMLVNHVMDHQRGAVTFVLKQLRLGKFDMTPPIAGEAKKASKPDGLKSKRTLGQENRLAKLKSNTHAAAKLAEQSEGQEGFFWKKYEKLEDLDVNELGAFATAIEPQTCSKANLRHKDSGQSNCWQKDKLLEIIEYMTGYHRSFELIGPLRDRAYLIKVMQFENQRRGRRALCLPLPPKWGTEGAGLVQIKAEGHCIIVEHNFADKSAELSREELPPLETVGDLYVSVPHSETRLCVKSRKAPAHDGVSLLTVLGKGIVNFKMHVPNPPAEAMIFEQPTRLAIENDAPALAIQDIPRDTDDQAIADAVITKPTKPIPKDRKKSMVPAKPVEDTTATPSSRSSTVATQKIKPKTETIRKGKLVFSVDDSKTLPPSPKKSRVS